MKIIINRAACDGNGDCAAAAPALLTLDAEGNPQLLQDSFDESARDRAAAAVRACPKSALTLQDDP